MHFRFSFETILLLIRTIFTQRPPEYHLDAVLERDSERWQLAPRGRPGVAQLQVSQRVHACQSHLNSSQLDSI